MGVATNGLGFAIGKEGEPGRIISKSLGVYVTGKSVYNGPVRDMEKITIPGRNGSLFLDNGRYENIEVTYHCGMYDSSQSTFASAISTLRNNLYQKACREGYMYLYDDYNTDEFRLAVYKGGLEVDSYANSTAGEFDLVFDCKPQRFLKTGDTVYTPSSGATFTNPTFFDSQPLISFQTTGSGTFTLSHSYGNQTITVSGAPSGVTIYIDCELGDAYRISGTDLIPLNNYVSFGTKLPVFYPGTTTFTYSNSISSVNVTPRWWRL